MCKWIYQLEHNARDNCTVYSCGAQCAWHTIQRTNMSHNSTFREDLNIIKILKSIDAKYHILYQYIWCMWVCPILQCPYEFVVYQMKFHHNSRLRIYEATNGKPIHTVSQSNFYLVLLNTQYDILTCIHCTVYNSLKTNIYRNTHIN